MEKIPASYIYGVKNLKKYCLTLMSTGYLIGSYSRGGALSAPNTKLSKLTLFRVLRAKTSLLSENIAQY